jgi:hypothetical protein
MTRGCLGEESPQNQRDRGELCIDHHRAQTQACTPGNSSAFAQQALFYAMLHAALKSLPQKGQTPCLVVYHIPSDRCCWKRGIHRNPSPLAPSCSFPRPGGSPHRCLKGNADQQLREPQSPFPSLVSQTATQVLSDTKLLRTPSLTAAEYERHEALTALCGPRGGRRLVPFPGRRRRGWACLRVGCTRRWCRFLGRCGRRRFRGPKRLLGRRQPLV